MMAGFSLEKDFVLTPARTDFGGFGEASSCKEGIVGKIRRKGFSAKKENKP
jgi:hypothetical protein